MMNLSAMLRSLIALIFAVAMVGCGGGGDSEPLQQAGNTSGAVELPNNSSSNTSSNAPVVVDFSYQPKFRHARLGATQVVDELMINGTGDLTHPQGEVTERGNITVAVDNIEDPDGIGRVLLGFDNAEQAIELCSENCVSPFKFTQTGVNPYDFGQSRGTVNLQVWVEDLNGNLSVVAIKQFNWQPQSVVVEPAQRQEDGSVEINWQPLESALRYNVYLSEEPINSRSAINAIPANNRFVALSNTSQSFSGLEPKKHYYVLVTGIDGSGESAFSESILLPATEQTPPIANNDDFTGLQFESISGNVLTNDLDLGFGPIEVVSNLVTAPSSGTVNISANGNFTYTPSDSFFGTDSFVYQIQNSQGATAQATVTLQIEAVRISILTLNNAYRVEKNTELAVSGRGVLVNDVHLLDQSLQIDTQPERNVTNGVLTLNAEGSFTYVPNSEFIGEDSFVYRVRSNEGEVQLAEVFISVQDDVTSIPPVAVNDAFETSEDFILSVSSPGVLENDTDEALSSVSISIETMTISGSLELTEEGGFRYVPNADFAGQDYFIYTITNEAGLSASAFGVINVVSVNDPPMAIDDSIEVAQGQPTAINVTSNDSDKDGELVLSTLEIVMQPMHGSVTFDSSTGQFIYQSDANYRGSDYFVYTVDDNEGAKSNEAFVQIFVTGENTAPMAVNDTASTSQGVPVDIDVLANDSDSDGTLVFDSIEITTNPSNGQVTLNASDSVLVYTPSSGFSGTDSFQYRVQDNENQFSNIASVTVTVQAVNQAPVANADSAQVEIGKSVTVAVLENDTDSDGTIDASTVEVVANPSKGTVNIGSTGEILYMHTGTAVGTDSFSYRVRDNVGALSNIALVSINIVEPDTTPIANADTASLDKNTSVMIDVLTNDDAKGQTLNLSSIEIISAVAHGSTFIDSSTGYISYIPVTNFVGTDGFTYQVMNNLGETSNVATVTITVLPKNYPPTVSPNSANIDTDVSNGDLVLQVSASDPDGDNISYTLSGTNASLFSIASNGQVTVANASQISSNGEAVYTLTVEVCDDISPALCASAQITINVSVAQTTYVANKLTTFGSDGEKVVRLRASMESHEAGQSLLLSDGTLLVVGGVGYWNETLVRNIHRASITKVLSDGHPDTSFASQGVFSSYFGIEVADQPQNIVAKAVAVDSSNRIYVAGYADFGATEAQELLIFRLTASGVHDTSYGAGSGYTKLPLTTGGRVTPISISVDDAQIVTVLSNVAVGENTSIKLTRVDTTGNITSSLDIAPSSSQYADGMIDLGSNLLVFGEVMSEAGNKDLLFVRVIEETLAIDTSFQSAGFLQIDIDSAAFDNQVHDVIQLSDGKLLLTGDSYLSGGSDKSVFVMRLNSDGSMDTSFNSTGYILYELNQLPASGIDGQDFSVWNAYGFGLYADDTHYYVGIGRGQFSTSSNAVQLFRTDLNGVIDTSWLPESGGPTAYRQFLLAPVDWHRTSQGLFVYGYQYRSVGNNFFYSQWMGEFTLSAALNSNFGSAGEVNLDTGDANESFTEGLSVQSSSSQLLLTGNASTWQNSEVPYVYKLDNTGKGVASFGNLGKMQLALSTSVTTTTAVEALAGNILLAGNQTVDQAVIVNVKNDGQQDFDFIPGSSATAIGISASAYGGTGSTIEVTKLYTLPTTDFIAFAKINDGCIDQSHAFFYSSVGLMLGHFQYPVPSEVSCGTTARGIDFIHPVSTTELVGIGTDEQVFSEPRVILAKSNLTGDLDTSFGTAGVSALDIGLVSGETMDLKGSFVDSQGKFVIFGTGGSKNFVLRVNTDGSIDSSFGSGGVLIFEQLGTTAVVVKQGWVQSTGELVLFLQESSGQGIYIARVTLTDDAGTFDTTFNSVGYQNFSISMTGQLSSAISLNNGDSFVLVLQQDEPKVIVLQAGIIEIAD
ncbi:Ig-like domain-containing protein [Pseudoalteromonas luteoviolacea]|nr:Ig-like domain-containing protein [Pseudoalteromonas luteoviolacea]